jgi:ATP-dependent Lhr-like helicase
MYELIKRNKTTLIFVNTRSQAEMLFQDFWRMNDDGLAIALHHGSLDVAQRRKVEDAMAAGKLRGVVCTSSLDLGIDWGDIDLVINVGAPKGSSRLMQRIGRANHRLDEPSRAVLIPANRFEVLECRVAIDAIAENAQDTPPLRTGGLDVLAQHVLGCACGEPFLSDELYAEVLTSAPYASLTRTDFDDVVDFVATGGYALKTYERFARIKQDKQGRWRVTNPRVRQSYRLNVGTIVEEHHAESELVRGRGGGPARPAARPRRRMLGEIEEALSRARHRRHFCVRRRDRALRGAGRGSGLRLPRQRQGCQSAVLHGRQVSAVDLSRRTRAKTAGRPAAMECAAGAGARLAVAAAAFFQRSCRARASDRNLSARRQALHGVLSFEGRLAHQTLGMLLTRRLERARARPLGFVANEYALAIWGLGDVSFMVRHGKLDFAALFRARHARRRSRGVARRIRADEAHLPQLRADLRLIPRRFTGEEKSRRQVLFSTDLVYDVLRKHQADHVLLRAARADAAPGLLDLKRLGDMLSRIQGRITHRELEHVSPLAVPVMLEIGRESVYGEAADELLAEAADELVKEAMG